jgi:AmiR/NasT family two-component response regulator
MPQLRSALTSRVIIEQAKGFLHETLDVSVEEAFQLMRSYARAEGERLTDVASRLISDRNSRSILLAGLAEFAAGPPH